MYMSQKYHWENTDGGILEVEDNIFTPEGDDS